MRRVLTVLLAVVALTGLAAVPALAQDPFQPIPQAPQPTPTVVQVAPSSSGDDGGGGLKTWQELLIFAGAIALIGGIAFAILGDARRSAPAGDLDEVRHPSTASGSRAPRDKGRAKAQRKRAKAARRANR